MASVVRNLMKAFDKGVDNADPHTRHWLLINNSPWQVWNLTVVYLVVVLVGPIVMKNRKPMDLKRFIIVYNVALVIMSLYILIEVMASTIDAGYSYTCQPYDTTTTQDPKELRVATVVWWYFFTKAIELVDTLLMVLRKKNNQITFLHVFHHTSMLNIWWWATMFIPCGMSVMAVILNSGIHVIMYTYYTLAAIPSLRGKLWWKKYLTVMQLTQFAILFVYVFNSIFIMEECDFPMWGMHLQFYYMIVMIGLFGNFYFQTYTQKSKEKAAAQNKKESLSLQNGYVPENGHVPGMNGVNNNKKHS